MRTATTCIERLCGKRLLQIANFLIVFSSENALANDSNYNFHIVNFTNTTATVSEQYEGCTSWTNGMPNWPIIVSPMTSMSKINYYRASRCSGKNGQVGLKVVQTSLNNSGTFNIDMNYDTDGGNTINVGNGFVDSANVLNYVAYSTPNTSEITVYLFDKSDVSILAARASGCIDGTNLVKKISSDSTIGSITKQMVDGYSSGGTMQTNLNVTSLIWGFRSQTFAPSQAVPALQAGFLLSKFVYNMNRPRANVESLWERYGPSINASPDIAPAFRLLAVQSSDTPLSQTVSVALDYQTAAGFGQQTEVYAFQLKPNSPIIGYKNSKCSVKGEMQIQPAGGTMTSNLMKSSDGTHWLSWDGTEWVPSDVVPVNRDW